MPTLFDVDPAGTAVPISRGFLNLRYRDGLAAERPLPAGEELPVRVTFKNQDWTVSGRPPRRARARELQQRVGDPGARRA